ncbi:MAG: DNA-3-methyladenine glycosylase [Ruminiclostridium sp.]|nr:DNA-3-methyladenine glycosylase [Ruminiclostridium sp.]
MSKITDTEFFSKTALELAPLLLGKLLCTDINGEIKKLRITETECYMGTDDLGCHASKGKTERTAVMFGKGGVSYVYLIYGMHNMFNVVCGEVDSPEAVLIRCCEGYNGPAKLTKFLGIDRSLNKVDLTVSDKIWLEDDGFICGYTTKPRVGIDYAGEYWSKIEWRFVSVSEVQKQ